MFVHYPHHESDDSGVESIPLPATARVLYLTESPPETARVRVALAAHDDIHLVEAADREAFLSRLDEADAVVCALAHPNCDAHAVLGTVRLRAPRLPVIVLAEPGHEPQVEAALRAGAWSYLLKTPRYPERLHHAIRAVHAHRHHLERWRHAVAARDLHARHAAELEATCLRMEAFAHTVAHDLRAPLHAIGNFASLLEGEAGRLSDDGREAVGRIVAGVERMSRLIDDVLEFSRNAFGPFDWVPIDMQALAQEAVDEMRVVWPRAEVEIGTLAPALGDPSAIRRVWQNLIGNAFKFSAPVAHPRVLIDSATVGREMVYSVVDNGIGFDPAQGRRLFGLFERLHAAGEFPGTGAGLAIVRQIVERHGGRAWAVPGATGGAVFRFTLRTVRKPAGRT